MRYIGFRNFRKFENLEPLELAPISIFVGGNNSGKSTVVKGILSIMSFLEGDYDIEAEDDTGNSDEQNDSPKNRIWVSHNQRFRFNLNYYAHIGTCKRALKNGANPKEIAFMFGIGNADFEIVVNIDDDSDEATSGRVSRIEYYHRVFKITILFNLIDWKADVVFHPSDPEPYRQRALSFPPESPDYAYLMRRYDYFRSFEEDVILKIELPDINRPGISQGSLFGVLFSAVEASINASIQKEDQAKKGRMLRGFTIKKMDIDDATESFLKNKLFWDVEWEQFSFPIDFRMSSRSERFEYVYAHAVTQSVIYSAKDTNDYLVKTVHEFSDCRISHTSKGDKKEIYKFIKKWMGLFGIGTDFVVQSVGGEAHIVKIRNKNGEEVNMADMGMGSIQLLILLFRLGVILNRSLRQRGTTIILEEPEQNLHPKLQSKLADLLFEVNDRFGVRFIVETHSEYLIRKTQVIVGSTFDTEEKIKHNPFKVIYFPDGGMQPYDMEYTTSGKFAKPFGEGFFDEAANLHMTVLRNSRK